VPRLLSIQVGLPTTHDDPVRPWRTGFFKSQVDGPVWLGRINLAGDGQGNRKVHGGPDKAVLMYAAAHYALWRAELQKPDLPHGAFAENFTVADLDEQTACLGDIYALGEARVQVSQPRQPCSNITRRWRIDGLTQQVERTGRTGWYLRVLNEGLVEAGLEVRLVERPNPDWSVARATHAMQQRWSNPAEAAALAALPTLSVAWRDTLRPRAVA
jgi:MOSC domain-containing protein YiiM